MTYPLTVLARPTLSAWTWIVLGAVVIFTAYTVITGDRYWMFFVGLLLAYSLFASSLDLLVGYAGLLAFSHAAFFGVGAYVFAIATADHGVSPWLALVLVTLAAIVIGCFIGLLGARLRDIQFAIVMLAIGQLFWTLANQMRSITGGDEGRVIMRRNALPEFLSDQSSFLYFSLVIAVIGMLILRAVSRSPFGVLLMATHSQEKRLPFMGYNISVVRMIAAVIAGIVAAWSGCLYAMQVQFVDPSMLYWTTTTTALVAILVGGTRTIVGGFIGTTFYLLLEDKLSSVMDDWMLVVGAVLVLVILFARGGLLGVLAAPAKSQAAEVRK